MTSANAKTAIFLQQRLGVDWKPTDEEASRYVYGVIKVTNATVPHINSTLSKTEVDAFIALGVTVHISS
jgi:hypothetical protein